MAKVLESKKEDIKFSESFIMSGESDLLVRDLAKKLEQNDIIISDKCLRDFLVKIKIIVKRVKVNGDWEITANAVRKGFAHYRDKNICTESGKVIYARTIYITGKGYKYILSSIMVARKVISYYVEACSGIMAFLPDRSHLVIGIINSIFAQKLIIR